MRRPVVQPKRMLGKTSPRQNRGSTAVVKWLKDNRAAKCVKLKSSECNSTTSDADSFDSFHAVSVLRELAVLTTLRGSPHGNCIHCFDVILHRDNLAIFVFPRYRSNVAVFLLQSDCTSMTARHKSAIMLGLADALVHLHAHDIVHADVKWENVLLNSASAKTEDVLIPCLCDFGMARANGTILDKSDTITTLSHRPIELMAQQLSVTTAIDTWSFGVAAYGLCHHTNHPFGHRNCADVLYNIMMSAPSVKCHWKSMRDLIAQLQLAPGCNTDQDCENQGIQRQSLRDWWAQEIKQEHLETNALRQIHLHAESQTACDVALSCFTVFDSARPPMHVVRDLLLQATDYEPAHCTLAPETTGAFADTMTAKPPACRHPALCSASPGTLYSAKGEFLRNWIKQDMQAFYNS